MNTSQPLLDPVTPYKYVGGDPALDFINTVDWTDRGPEKDRFTNYDRLLEWAEGAGMLSRQILEGLHRAATQDGYAAEQVVRDAVALRELLERTFSRLVRRKNIAEELAELNRTWLARSLSAMALVERGRGSRDRGERRHAGARGRGDGSRSAGGRHGGSHGISSAALASHTESSLALGWPRAAQTLASPLWIVAWSAARLLASDEAKRIRRCEGMDCGWYYVDRSRNGLRRWCEMETCGTIMKTRRRAVRNAQARAAGDRAVPTGSADR